MNIIIKRMETDEEIKGKAFVHFQSWQEAYSGIVKQAYMDNTNYVVKRLDPFAKVKDRCIKCNEPGYDYLLYDRRQSH